VEDFRFSKEETVTSIVSRDSAAAVAAAVAAAGGAAGATGGVVTDVTTLKPSALISAAV